MNKFVMRQSLLLLLTATIWGVAFVAQSVGMDYIGPFTFNVVRNVIGGLVLIPCIAVFHRTGAKEEDAGKTPGSRKNLLLGGICCGVMLFVAGNLQQIGIQYTTVGKAGFITALYIVLVPIFGIFLKKRVPKAVWFSVVLAVAGLYCLCVTESFTISSGDICVVLCAFVFTCQILLVDHFVTVVDGIELSCCQFFFVTLFSLAGSLAFEQPTLEGFGIAAGAILYAGFFSSGVAYTLQILAQKGSNPTVISLLLSLESVFATISSAIILGDRLSGKEYFGCALMLAAVVLAQLPEKKNA